MASGISGHHNTQVRLVPRLAAAAPGPQSNE